MVKKTPIPLNIDKELLKRLIRQKFNSQEDLGKFLGISKQTISSKIKKPSRKFLEQLTDKANLDLSPLFADANENIDVHNIRSGRDSNIEIGKDIASLGEVIAKLNIEKNMLETELVRVKTENEILRGQLGQGRGGQKRS